MVRHIHVGVRVDLDDLRLPGPVLDAVLRQGAERIEPRTEREDDVGLLDEDHRRLPALVAERPDRERMARGEAVVVEIAVRDGSAQALGEPAAFIDRIAQHHPGPRHDERVLRFLQHRGRGVDRVHVAGLASRQDRVGDVDVDHLAEVVAGNVELDRRGVLARALEAPAQRLHHAGRVREGLLMAGDLLEVRKLAGLLEPSETLRLHAGLRGHDDHRCVVPVRCRHRGDEVGDARPVLCDAHRDLAVCTGVSVRHVGGALLVRDIDESNPGALEYVESRHERGADDSEGHLYSVDSQRFDERFMRRHLHLYVSC